MHNPESIQENETHILWDFENLSPNLEQMSSLDK